MVSVCAGYGLCPVYIAPVVNPKNGFDHWSEILTLYVSTTFFIKKTIHREQKYVIYTDSNNQQ